jgi:hypothetical protein
MARPSARARDGARRGAVHRAAKVGPVRPRKLTKAEHQLPDGRYLLAYGYETTAPSDA